MVLSGMETLDPKCLPAGKLIKGIVDFLEVLNALPEDKQVAVRLWMERKHFPIAANPFPAVINYILAGRQEF